MERFNEDMKSILLRNKLSVRAKNQTSTKGNDSFDALNHHKLLFEDKFSKLLDQGNHTHFQLCQV